MFSDAWRRGGVVGVGRERTPKVSSSFAVDSSLVVASWGEAEGIGWRRRGRWERSRWRLGGWERERLASGGGAGRVASSSREWREEEREPAMRVSVMDEEHPMTTSSRVALGKNGGTRGGEPQQSAEPASLFAPSPHPPPAF